MHMCSAKGAPPAAEPIEDGVPVYYGDDNCHLMVPRGHGLSDWMCATLGLDSARHWVGLKYGRHTLKSRDEETAAAQQHRAVTSVVNNNNNAIRGCGLGCAARYATAYIGIGQIA